MNFTSRLSLANENGSEETNGWNSTGTTPSSSTSWLSADVDGLTVANAVVQWIIFVVATVGNLMVLVVLAWRRSRSQVGTQLFVGSLAVSDIGLMLSAVWVEAYSELQKSWPFGVIPCKLQFMWRFLTMNCYSWRWIVPYGLWPLSQLIGIYMHWNILGTITISVCINYLIDIYL